MKTIYPKKLQKGDEVRIIASAQSMSIISKETRAIANKAIEKLGLKLSFGKHVEESDVMQSSSIKSRLQDLHEAFADPKIKGIFTVIGGYNCNQLLDYIDWDIIRSNPKILCGYSDITALSNAILAQVGLVTYSGPHYSTFGKQLANEYTVDYFKKCLMSEKPINIQPSKKWDDKKWYINQQDRTSSDNPGPYIINKGKATGTILGGNLGTFTLLSGTKYMPSLYDSVLFIEDCESSGTPVEFDRNLQSLIHQKGFDGVRGIVIGRFQIESEMSKEKLEYIIKTKKELNDIPVIADADFGHTYPLFSYPIGGTAKIDASGKTTKITIVKH